MKLNEAIKKKIIRALTKLSKEAGFRFNGLTYRVIDKVKEFEFYSVDETTIVSLAKDDIVCCTADKFYYCTVLEYINIEDFSRIVLLELFNYINTVNYYTKNRNKFGKYDYDFDRQTILACFGLQDAGVSGHKLQALYNSVSSLDDKKLDEFYNKWLACNIIERKHVWNHTKFGTELYMEWNKGNSQNIQVVRNDDKYIVFEYTFNCSYSFIDSYTINTKTMLITYDAKNNEVLEIDNPIHIKLVEDTEIMRELMA